MAGDFGQFGSSPRSFSASPFAKWFSLKPAPERVGRLRPEGAAFHDLVSIDMETQGVRLSALVLTISRAMIDDPRNGPFARDIAKSFLLALAADDAGIARLADEIMHRDVGAAMIRRGAAPPIPVEPSPAYRAFAGQGAAYVIDLPGLAIDIARGKGDALCIAARRAGDAPSSPSFLSRLWTKLSGR
jgi:hypothetical protein